MGSRVAPVWVQLHTCVGLWPHCDEGFLEQGAALGFLHFPRGPTASREQSCANPCVFYPPMLRFFVTFISYSWQAEWDGWASERFTQQHLSGWEVHGGPQAHTVYFFTKREWNPRPPTVQSKPSGHLSMWWKESGRSGFFLHHVLWGGMDVAIQLNKAQGWPKHGRGSGFDASISIVGTETAEDFSSVIISLRR